MELQDEIKLSSIKLVLWDQQQIPTPSSPFFQLQQWLINFFPALEVLGTFLEGVSPNSSENFRLLASYHPWCWSFWCWEEGALGPEGGAGWELHWGDLTPAKSSPYLFLSFSWYHDHLKRKKKESLSVGANLPPNIWGLLCQESEPLLPGCWLASHSCLRLTFIALPI